jgi:starch-binding outer membrane protein, SusD/RagB family
MKKTIIIYIVFIATLISSCNNLDEIQPIYTLEEGVAITDNVSAQVALNGVYSQLRDDQGKNGFVKGVSVANSMMGLSYSGGPTGNTLALNEPKINSKEIEGLYASAYAIIQEANLFIERVEKLPAGKLGGETAKNNFLAEARFLRSLSHFYLLRNFGQFYNPISAFGITLRLKPAYTSAPIARSSVAESYSAIYADLDFAVANCTNTKFSYFANAEAANAIKAKVLLYQGKYQEAATLSMTIINGTTRHFTDSYIENYGKLNPATGKFDYGHNSPELFFGPYFTEETEVNNGSFLSSNTEGSVYEAIARPDPFDPSSWDRRAGEAGFLPFPPFDPTTNPLVKGANFDFSTGAFKVTPATHIHMRLAELYLIHAEAAARIATDVDAAALQSLNAIRTRPAVNLPAYVSGTDINTKAELLEAIRKEKLLELYSENGEEFFDLIRYGTKGDINPATVKPTMDNIDKYIFPIPWSEMKLPSSSIIQQNPGYPRTL